MKGHRSGRRVTVCDGCYKVIPKDATPPQVLNADGTRMDWCGLEECNVKIRSKTDPPWRCPNCVHKGENKQGCDHVELKGGKDREYGEKATEHTDVIY